MIICLCICKGRIVDANDQKFKLYWLMTEEHDIVLLVTIKSHNVNSIRDETH